MRYRTLGNTGLRVSEAFLGTMTFGQAWGWGATAADCETIINLYADAGGNVIDTASNYTEGQSEQIIGAALQGRRDQFVLASKYGFTTDPADPNAGGGHRKNLKRALERSLRNLKTDYLDIYWVHVWDEKTPAEETLRALDDAVREGKILHIGFSNVPAWVISRLDGVAQLRGWSRPAAVQVPYSLVQRDAERELIPMARVLGMSVVAYAPLAGGVLTGKYTTKGSNPLDVTTRGGGQRLDAERVSDRDRAAAISVAEVAEEIGATSAQVALAWILTRESTIQPILGARTPEQLKENLAALNFTLTEEHMNHLEFAAPHDLGYPMAFINNVRTIAFGEHG